jgi:hypothetical protein
MEEEQLKTLRHILKTIVLLLPNMSDEIMKELLTKINLLK